VQAQVCVEPKTYVETDDYLEKCNWLAWGREEHPLNCARFMYAETFCAWIGGRLPTESEWEFAARSRGKDNEYPWGNADPSCDLAVIKNEDGEGCGTGHTWPVCSKPLGNTEQGLCDMSGNVMEWVADCWFNSYEGNPPTDGSAWDMPFCDCQVRRGGAFLGAIETRYRACDLPSSNDYIYGIRCARDAAGK